MVKQPRFQSRSRDTKVSDYTYTSLLDGNIVFRLFFMINQLTGKDSENRICEFLIEKEFEILSRNFRSSYGEIDIIAYKDESIHFVEVKHIPMSWEIDQLVYKVNISKQSKIKITAKVYLVKSDHKNYNKISFDVACVQGDSIYFWEEAFQ